MNQSTLSPIAPTSFRYAKCLAASERVAWRIQEVLPDDARFDFDAPMLPEGLLRLDSAPALDAADRRLLSQVRGHTYLAIFGLVEEFILPFVLDHARAELPGNDTKSRALLTFAAEESKHIELFRRFRSAFTAQFGHTCEVIGPAEDIARAVLTHDPLGVALVVLHIEWMTQRHWIECVRDTSGTDPLFRSLLEHHWMEEAQHAKLDTLMVESLAQGRDAAGLRAGVDAYLAIGGLLDAGLASQAEFDVAALESARGRGFATSQRASLVEHTHQANRWTYLGSGMAHPEFLRTMGALGAEHRARVEGVAPLFS